MALVAGGFALLLLLNTASAANEVRRHDLAAQDASIAAQLQELSNEVASSAAPGNLADAAAQLGMVPAGNPAFLVVGPDGKITVLGSPARVSGAGVDIIPAKTSKAHPSRTPSKSASTSAGKSAGKSSGNATPTRSPTPTRSRTRKPAPTTAASTPTPTVTLPGGNR